MSGVLTYCGNEIVSFVFPDDGVETIHLNYSKPVDKIRITVYDSATSTLSYSPGILVWSSIVNNYIGATLTKLVEFDGVNNYDFSTPCKQKNSMEWWYPNKITINGDHEVRLTNFLGAIPNNITHQIYILVEYFSYL